MQKKAILLSTFIPVIICLFSCNNAADIGHTDQKQEIQTTTDAVATAEAATDPKDWKLMKTADLRARVVDVYHSVSLLEKAVKDMGGIVIASKTGNEVTHTEQLPYNADSIRQATAYTTYSYLTVRLPSGNLDSFLSIIGAEAQFLNERNIQMEDATLPYLTNELKNRPQPGDPTISETKNLAKNSMDMMHTSMYADEKNREQIDRYIDNLSIMNKVQFATISISLHQPGKLDFVVLADINKQMKASKGTLLKNAFLSGWNIFVRLLIGLVHLWPFITALLLVLFFVRKYGVMRSKIKPLA